MGKRLLEGKKTLTNYERTLEEFRTKIQYNEWLNKDVQRIEYAILFGSKKHHGQTRKNSADPYFIHPLRVAMALIPEQDSTSFVIIAALLHDTVEDTNTTFEEIENNFGKRVKVLVDGMTKPETLTKQTVGKNISKTDYYDYFVKIKTISKVDNRIFKIKLADRADNLREYLSFATMPKIENYVWET